jgi:RNA polymerase sigma-70 factor, ECF subfamily
MSAPDVLELLRGLILGDRAALVAVARREGLGPEDAIDCVQDGLCTLLDVFARRELALELHDDLRRYVAGIVRNVARNRRRRHHLARPHVPIEAIDPPGDTPTSESLIARAEDHVRVHACVARLCDTQRAVVTLRLLEEREGEDVATTLGLTRGHVDVLLHRAKHSLRSCLAEHDSAT